MYMLNRGTESSLFSGDVAKITGWLSAKRKQLHTIFHLRLSFDIGIKTSLSGLLQLTS